MEYTIEEQIRWMQATRDLTEKVRAKFQERCVFCGEYSRIVHHIYPFQSIVDDNEISTVEEALACEELWDAENLVVVCKECHAKIHPWLRAGSEPRKGFSRWSMEYRAVRAVDHMFSRCARETVDFLGHGPEFPFVDKAERRYWIGRIYLANSKPNRVRRYLGMSVAQAIANAYGYCNESDVRKCAKFALENNCAYGKIQRSKSTWRRKRFQED